MTTRESDTLVREIVETAREARKREKYGTKQRQAFNRIIALALRLRSDAPPTRAD